MISVHDYFEWLCSCVCNGRQRIEYNKMLNNLFETQFTYIIEMDANRASDGIDLRYQFGRDRNEKDSIIAAKLDIYPCNVLEVLVALSFRIENVMENPETGNRVGFWFWMMIKNLSLDKMTDDLYDEARVNTALYIFMNRLYERNGSGGGLVVLEHPRLDMRFVEIWDQINWYLSENYI